MSGGGAFDAILVGGGHNGLIAAAYLARGGLRTLVLEAADRPGGGAVNDEIHPGFRVPALAHILTHLDPRVVRDLDLPGHGLALCARDLTSVALMPDGGSLALPGDPESAAQALAGISRSDADRYAAFRRRLLDHAASLRMLLQSTPPRLGPHDRGSRLKLARLAWAIRRRGKPAMRDLLRIVGMNVADLLEEAFETDALMGAMALDAVLGTDHGPRSPNTVFTLLYRLAGQAAGRAGGLALPRGGMGRVTDALVAAAGAGGVKIRTGARVARVLVESGVVRGVELAGGEVIEAGIVVSNADPRTTCLDLVGPDHLDADFLSDVRALRVRGTAGKVNFALDGPPNLPGAPGGGGARWLLAPSIDYVEEAFDHVKYGELPPAPALEVTVPSLSDPDLAPPGRHVVSVNVAYAPHSEHVDGERVGDTVTALLERHAPGFTDRILARQALGPREIGARFNSSGGHWHHADIALDQFFMLRPVPGFAQYRAPVDGLYLCGAGSHPGGGVMGLAGRNAAREILKDCKRRRRVA